MWQNGPNTCSSLIQAFPRDSFHTPFASLSFNLRIMFVLANFHFFYRHLRLFLSRKAVFLFQLTTQFHFRVELLCQASL